METTLTEEQIKSGKISIHLDIQLPSLETAKIGKKRNGSIIVREAGDRITSLSQEQTVLLMYYLQKERVMLKDEYLSDTDAGEAFQILTGYSQNTLRQTLSKFYTIQSDGNLKALNELLTRLKKAVEEDLKSSQ